MLQQLPREDLPQKDKLMSISIAAFQGQNGDETISLPVIIGGMQAVALVDSSSSNTFDDHDFAVKLNLPMRNTAARKVIVAGGGTLTTEAVVSNYPFSIQKVQFHSDFRVFPLQGYDLVLGVS
jgi:hypothetical protein